MTTPILLPPLPALAERTVCIWVRHESGRYDSLFVDILALIRARDLEVARVVLEGAARWYNDEGREECRSDVAECLRNLKVKHHE
jgi:hypothetical protein